MLGSVVQKDERDKNVFMEYLFELYCTVFYNCSFDFNNGKNMSKRIENIPWNTKGHGGKIIFLESPYEKFLKSFYLKGGLPVCLSSMAVKTLKNFEDVMWQLCYVF